MVVTLFTNEYYNLDGKLKKTTLWKLSALMWDLGYCYRFFFCPRDQNPWAVKYPNEFPSSRNEVAVAIDLDGAKNWKSTWTLYSLSTKSVVICLSMKETLTCKLRRKLAVEQVFSSQLPHLCLASGILKLCYHMPQKCWAKVGGSQGRKISKHWIGFLIARNLSEASKAHAAKESGVPWLSLSEATMTARNVDKGWDMQIFQLSGYPIIFFSSTLHCPVEKW